MHLKNKIEADPKLCNRRGETPLHFAAKRGLAHTIELLINAGKLLFVVVVVLVVFLFFLYI